MLGVTTSASGSSCARRASTAAGSSRRAPLFATITGSTTRFTSRCSATFAATASMMAALASIPVFTASGLMSETTASICSATKPGGTTWTPVTAVVFWAVSAVMADMPYTPRAANVFRSACIPAPPLESEPAMVRAERMAPPTLAPTAYPVKLPPLLHRERGVHPLPAASPCLPGHYLQGMFAAFEVTRAPPSTP